MDIWSINHLLGGSLLAGFIYLRGDDLWIGFGISFLAMVAWEIFELVRNIHEFFWNRVLDLVIGVIGFLLTIDLIPGLQNEHAILSLVIILLAFFGLEIWGYLAYRFRVSQKMDH